MHDDVIELLIDVFDQLNLVLIVEDFVVVRLRFSQSMEKKNLDERYFVWLTFSNCSRSSFRLLRHLAAACLFLSRRCRRFKSSSSGS
jgi:hypothetical protein